jgi:histone H4
VKPVEIAPAVPQPKKVARIKLKAQPKQEKARIQPKKEEEVPAASPPATDDPPATIPTQIGKRHRRILRDNIKGITNPSIRRLARKGGVKRMSEDIYEAVRTDLKDNFLTERIRVAVLYAQHAGRKTVMVSDIQAAAAFLGRPLWGVSSDPKCQPKSIFQRAKASAAEGEAAPAPESPVVA